MKDYKIKDIETMTEEEVKELTNDSINYKGYTVYFVDLGGYFKYSRLVYKNGRPIYHTNDYELHHSHSGKTHEELREYYIDGLQYKLFEPADLETVKDYIDYEHKIQWIMSYFPQQFEHYTAFVIQGTEEAKQLEAMVKKGGMYYSHVCICYFKDPEPVKTAHEYLETLHKAKEQAENNFDYWVAAFKHELWNHEYSINMQGNYDVFSCFGEIEYKGDRLYNREEIADYMNQLNFTDTQRNAWKQAITEYSKAANY